MSNKDFNSKESAQAKGLLQPGQKAPDFTLKSMPDQQVTLSQFHGKPIILAFYPGDWSPVCTDQLALYNQLLPEFEKYDAVLLGISVDSTWSHKAFSEARHLHFPLLADFEPKGAVGRMFGIYNDQKGKEKRALFVIDREGTIRWSYISPNDENPGADGILCALEDLPVKQENYGQTNQTC